MPPLWPPYDGSEYVASDEFGQLLVEIVDTLQSKYPDRDFTDAVAQVFVWFSGKLDKEPCFLELRFPTVSTFRAYVKQAVWNASVLAARQRWKRSEIESLPVDYPIRSEEPSAEELAILQEQVQALDEPHKSVLERLFFEEEDANMVASILNLTYAELTQVYEEALEMLQRELRPAAKKKRRR